MRTFCFLYSPFRRVTKAGIVMKQPLTHNPSLSLPLKRADPGNNFASQRKKKLSYKLRVCCYFSQTLRINRVRGSAQSGFLLGNRRAKVSIFSTGTCVLRVLIDKETSHPLSSKMRRRDKRDWMNNGRLCILFFPEPEQIGSPGSWRASETYKKHPVCFDHHWCSCQGYSYWNGRTSGRVTKDCFKSKLL